MENTKIEWATHTWNPWSGCAKVSAGCANCYAEALDNRWHKGEHWGRGAPRKRASDATLRLPLKWNREAEKTGVRPRVFCLSMGDWLDPEVPIQWLYELLDMVRRTPNLDWLLLTKRPELWRQRVSEAKLFIPEIESHEQNIEQLKTYDLMLHWLGGRPPKNVWIGFSAENQEMLVERWPHATAIPAVCLFISCEPLLGGLSLPDATPNPFGYFGDGIHWVIVGGESGPRARECNLAWIEDIVKQCREAKVPVFVKQLGSYPILNGEPLKLRDSKGSDMSEWPESLRVREFPAIHLS